MVVLPAPLGAEKMIALPCDMVRGVGRGAKLSLENVVDLFFYFFEFVFHDYNESLHIGIVCFAANGIHFAPDFLGNKAEFFPLRLSAQLVAEVRAIRF
jgi:hypothetical protein